MRRPDLFFRSRDYKPEPGDVVRTPMGREARVIGRYSTHWRLVYTDDHQEVMLTSNLLTLVMRGGEPVEQRR